MALPQTVASNGQITFKSGPPLHTGFIQNITGSPLDAATAKTLSGISTQAVTSRNLGVGQRAGGTSAKLHRFRKRGGALFNTASLNAKIPSLPEAHSIKGVSSSTNHINGVNTLNQIRADKVYDSLIDATPTQMGSARAGFRIRDEEEMYGSGKRLRENGRSRKRTHRRKHRKYSATRRRSHRHI
jgi:hypothetical protein